MSAPDERDIYRAARLLIDQHGPTAAEVHAAQRIDELTAAGDMDGRRAWRRIMEAVRELSATKPCGTVH